MSANLTTAESILKEFYIAPIIEQLNQETFALNTFETESVDWQGKRAIVPVHIARNSGTGFRAEGQPLPTAGAQGYERLEIPAKFAYGRFGFTGPSLEFSDTDKGSFEPVMTGEMKRLVDDMRNLLDKACFTGGPMIGLIWQKANAATFEYSGRPSVVVDPIWGVDVGVGHTVDLVRLDTYATIAAGLQVNAITETSITLNAAVNLTIGGGIFVAGDEQVVVAVKHNDPARASEMSGVLDNLTNPTLYNVSRVAGSGNEKLQSNFLLADFTAAAPVYSDLSLDAIQILLDKILNASNTAPDLFCMNPVHRQSYTTLLQGTSAGNVRIMGDTGGGKKGDAGFTSLGYADIPFKTAQHAPKGSIHFWAKKFWGVFQRRPGDFAQADGKVLNKVPNFDAYEGFWKQYLNLVSTRPNAQGVLTGCNFFGV